MSCWQSATAAVHGCDDPGPYLCSRFFTTKEVGKGTGLGLAIVYGFVKQSAGHVASIARQGRGHIQVVSASRRGSGRVAKVRPGLAAMPKGTETLLLVETSVRAHIGRLRPPLVRYHVLEAGGGAEALRLAEEHGGVCTF